VVDNAAIVKIKGRANFTTSISFKRLIAELRERGLDNILLDLSDCVTMDSTFLGVLAGAAVKLSEGRNGAINGAAHRAGISACELRLLNPNQRVADLLDNLGVSELFRTVHCEVPEPSGQYSAGDDCEPEPSREEITRACLEAHQVLMAINPKNIPKFKDVAQFLSEDLKRLNSPS